MTKKLLFVCLGNICRSPTAHAVMRDKAKLAELNIDIDSAGTHASHRAEAPDVRSIREGTKFGYDFSHLHARPITEQDFSHYDMILAMDQNNLQVLQQRCPEQHQHKLQLFMQYHPAYPTQQEVPDPYYGGARGFSLVLQLIEAGCDGLCLHLQRQKT
ncbi:low molecular weight protein-tyrosine-phosphatase [Rheinheimera salexigens]|uniref:protein-tyrosine-phosphatase n=1 Tax=Rheinheimera salexigens TaxID=1628148 RepID=A0A1E7Q612_9GAMM|nr:low molecular weight protein-tyrosine-phosphatase [Rheinheimera salexigens]OEY69622.1 protein-tyrosine-phosphatase [Rheinheimera salexigens]